MTAARLILFYAVVAVLAASCSAGLLDQLIPRITAKYYSQMPTKDGYRFEQKEPNGSSREEVGIIMNPGTPDEQLVVMGTYSTYDEKTDTESITMYTADKGGYNTRYTLKKRKLSANALKSLAKG
ncbi:hypothetical protein AWZ03_001122 [Drosophila navojoa]|uniref:Uncharacterized protein n=1 Tax=Drosophila navojoa TaxID=7232 RepID=A0A484BWA9_DRONA|nr:uncharacterized protein LOC108660395 [Drosophila navojoa]TDG52292.1 hypothetical protein AWZ03_001122 [Drosophila navojoa]